MKDMKKIIYLVLAVIGISVSSCEKILDKKPLDFYANLTEYYNTPEQLEGSVRAIYGQLKSVSLYSRAMLYQLGMEADEGYYTRSSPISGPHANNFTSSHRQINAFWEDLY